MVKAYLEPDEIEKLEMSAGNLRDRLLVRVLFHLGCRVSEALGLEVEHLDFVQNTVTIQHLKARINVACPECGARLSKRHIFCPGCGAKVQATIAKELEHRTMRTLPLDKTTLEMLHEYVSRGGPVEKNGRTLIFGINRGRAWQVVTSLAKKAGLPGIINMETGKRHNVSPHQLRDAFAVHAVKTNDTGDGLRLLQTHLGHQNITTTMRYRKVSGDEQRNWYQKLWPEEKT